MAQQLKMRNEIDPKYKWKLEDIYENETQWEEDFKFVSDSLPKISSYKDRVTESASTLLSLLKLNEEISIKGEKLYVYAKMRKDEDNTDTKYQALTERAMMLINKVGEYSSFIIPELVNINKTTLDAYMDTSKELKDYSFFFEDLLRQKEHVLTKKEEKLLAMSHDMSSAASDIFTMFNNADIKFGSINDEKGNQIELTKGNFIKFLKSKNRKVREDAFKTLYKSYFDMANSLGSMYAGNLKSDKFYAQARKYNSTLESALDSDNINPSVYNTLIDTVNKNLGLLHRYLEVRKKALKLDELHLYDVYVPIIEMPDKEIPYEQAKKLVIDGLAPLGSKYITDLTNGLESSWIDVYENKGKTSGAYSWGEYTAHPYVLLNYQGNINSVFTLAHEMGHSMHSFYTNNTQPHHYSHYKIFVAEVASTVNETLLMDYMLTKTTDKKERAYLLNHYLEEFRGTVFRQTMFAEYEKLVHDKVWNDEPINNQILSKMYTDLNKKYFGDNVIIDNEISMEWSRIPHFYRSFYVYKYATGFCSAQSIAHQIKTQGDTAREKYLNFLSSGGSNYPLELLKGAGVDLSTPKPIEDGMKLFDQILTELESLI